ncbi:hypothetical protein QTP88_023103 [Uroleucon formosanum]
MESVTDDALVILMSGLEIKEDTTKKYAVTFELEIDGKWRKSVSKCLPLHGLHETNNRRTLSNTFTALKSGHGSTVADGPLVPPMSGLKIAKINPSVEANFEYLEVVALHFEDDTEKQIEIRDETACINQC